MSTSLGKRRRIPRLTPFGWLVIGLAVAVGAGFAIGSKLVWIAALLILLLLLLGAFAVPRNVQDLNIPPFLTNEPGDVTHRDRDERD